MPSLAEAKEGQVAEISTEAEWKTALEHDVVIVDFSATWCGPCKMISPIFEKLAAQHTNAFFIKVDVDVNEKVAADAGVSAMPTFQFYVKGKKVEELVGASPDKLTQLIQKHAGPAPTQDS
jgi:thioredoxin